MVIVRFLMKVGDICGKFISVFGFGGFVSGGLDLLKIDIVGNVVIGLVGIDKRVFKVVNIVFKIVLVVERYVFYKNFF